MKETRINSNHVSHIKITPAVKTDYIWCNEIPKKKNWLGITTQYGYEEGFWWKGKPGFYSVRLDTDEYKEFVEIDGVLWSNPFLEIFANGKCIFGRHYETVEEIKLLCSREFTNVSIVLS